MIYIYVLSIYFAPFLLNNSCSIPITSKFSQLASLLSSSRSTAKRRLLSLSLSLSLSLHKVLRHDSMPLRLTLSFSLTEFNQTHPPTALMDRFFQDPSLLKKLHRSLPLLGALTVALVLTVGAWRAFGVENSLQDQEEMQPPSHLHRTPADEERRKRKREELVAYFNVSLTKEQEEMGMVNTGLPPYYHLGRHIEDWDRERELWLQRHPDKKNYTGDGSPRVFMLTGSQAGPCKTPGDYLLLRTFKNKVDYCRLHDIGLFYNFALLDDSMDNFWSKLPLVRAAMEAHPEVEWFWWADSDVIITDMHFKLPLESYHDYNLVVPGWDSEIYGKKSVMGLNAGSFLIRNCAWSVRFLDRWASMGPRGKVRDLAGLIQSAMMFDRPGDYPGDDQAALIYFMVEEHSIWGSKIHLENTYNLNGYWLDLVDHMDEIQAQEAKGGSSVSGLKRSFVTHFAGCQPCTGNRNPAFKPNQCERGMERALAFADNQVLHEFGFQRHSLSSYQVERLP